MSTDNFIPEVWSGRLLANLNNAHVFKGRCNTEYEGEISDAGDTVRINSIGRISVKDYTKNTDIDDAEQIDGAGQMLVIDQAKYYHFSIDDVDKAQQKPKLMDGAMKEASFSLADIVDLYLANEMRKGVASANQLTPGDVGTTANLYEVFVDLAETLDEQNTPTGDRWAVISPKMLAALRKDDRFASFGTESNRRTIRGGSIGDIADFTIHVSNNIPDGDDDAWGSGGFNAGISAGEQVLIAGYKGATTFAEQVVKTEAYRPQKQFSDAVKGLHVYGSQVLRPSNLAMATFGYD